MLPINSSLQEYITVDGINAKISADHRKGFSQKVIIGNQRLTVSVYYKDDNLISEEKIKSDMDVAIKKMVSLAKELGLGQEGLIKIQASPSQVTGQWKAKDKVITQDFKEKLKNDLDSANLIQIIDINRKIEFIEETQKLFSTQFPVASSIEPQKPALKSLQAQVEFNKVVESAQATANAIAFEEKNRLKTLLGIYTKQNTALKEITIDKIVKQNLDAINGLTKIREDLSASSLELKIATDRTQETNFNQLENQLIEMTLLVNSVVAERKKLEQNNGDKDLIAQLKCTENFMKNKITEINSLTTLQNLTTNAFTATKSNVMSFGAVLEKKLDLMESGANIKDNKNILETAYQELLNVPTEQQMTELASKISHDLDLPSISLISSEEAKKVNKMPTELKWGSSHLNFALTTPANWPILRTALVKESRGGRMYVAATIIEPLNIEKQGGVPAGLRSQSGQGPVKSICNQKKFDDRPVNLMKTTTYIKSDAGKECGKQVSFRGGQFPTPEAALTALKTIRANLPNGQKLEELHINALLTPTTLTMFNEDKALLDAHKKSILTAIERLSEEASTQKNPAEIASLKTLKHQIAISNFGVNEGAIGQTKMKSVLPTFGWHTAISEYSDVATQRLNQSLFRKMASIQKEPTNPDNLDSLGAFLQVGQELEAIWATNDYEDATIGYNQFKMPALLKTFDGLLNVICYSNCMSGKDRTSKVESTAQEYLDEIFMNVKDQKLLLAEHFDQIARRLNPTQQIAWNPHKNTLTAACFTIADLDKLAEKIQDVNGDKNFPDSVKQIAKAKIEAVKYGLGLEENGTGLMESKGSISRLTSTSTNNPKLKTRQINTIRFPKVSVSSVYRRDPIQWMGIKSEEYQTLEPLLKDRQRQARNRRDTQLTGHLQVTLINANRVGFKVKGGKPLERFSAGFDLDYVVLQLLPKSKNNVHSEFYHWTSLHELDKKTAQGFLNEVEEIGKKPVDLDQRIEQWTGVLRKIEKAHLESLSPQAKVKA